MKDWMNILYEYSDKLYSYQDFKKLLHQNVKINNMADVDLQLYGDIRTAFVIACERTSKYQIVVPPVEISDWDESELKNVNKKINLCFIDRIYNISYGYHYNNCKHFDSFHKIKIYARIQCKNRYLYVILYRNFIDVFDDDDQKEKYAQGYTFICQNPNAFACLYYLDFFSESEYNYLKHNDISFFKKDGIDILEAKSELGKQHSGSNSNSDNNSVTFIFHKKESKSKYKTANLSIKSDVIKYNKFLNIKKIYDDLVRKYDDNVCTTDSHWLRSAHQKGTKRIITKLARIFGGVLIIAWLLISNLHLLLLP